MDIQSVSSSPGTPPQTLVSQRNDAAPPGNVRAEIAASDPGQENGLSPSAIPATGTAAGTAATSARKEAPAAREELEEALKNANDGLKNLKNQSNALQFSVDEDLDRIIVRLVDSDTKEVIRQYPPEELLEIARQMDKLVGKLLKEKA